MLFRTLHDYAVRAGNNLTVSLYINLIRRKVDEIKKLPCYNYMLNSDFFRRMNSLYGARFYESGPNGIPGRMRLNEEFPRRSFSLLDVEAQSKDVPTRNYEVFYIRTMRDLLEGPRRIDATGSYYGKRRIPG